MARGYCIECERERTKEARNLATSRLLEQKGAGVFVPCPKCGVGEASRDNRECPACRSAAYFARRAMTDPEILVARARQARSLALVRNYGITADEWDQMFELQGEACAICRGTSSPSQKDLAINAWHTDHSHEDGFVRGILCGACNIGLGFREKHNWSPPGLSDVFDLYLAGLLRPTLGHNFCTSSQRDMTSNDQTGTLHMIKNANTYPMSA